MRRAAALAVFAAVACLCAPAVAPAVTLDDRSSAPERARAAAVERPQGNYTARAGRFLVSVSGRAIDLAAFDFGCRETTGRTTLTNIRIRRTRGRWRFFIATYGNVTYSDDHPDENARVRFSGTFSRNAERVTGRLVVSSPHCGSTGTVEWSARRRR